MTKAESSAAASSSASSSTHPPAPPADGGLGAANGYGMEDEEMGWASLGKPTWKGKGLSDEIKTVEVRRTMSSKLTRPLPFARCMLS